VRLYAKQHCETELTQPERDEAINRLLDHYRMSPRPRALT